MCLMGYIVSKGFRNVQKGPFTQKIETYLYCAS